MSNVSSSETDTETTAIPAISVRGQHASVPWSPWAGVLYAILVYFTAQLAANLIVIIYPHIRGWNHQRSLAWLSNTVTAQFFYVLFAEILTFGATWWFIRHRKAKLSAIGWGRPRLIDPAYAVLGYAAYFIVYAIVIIVVEYFIPSLNVNQKQQLGFNHTSGTINLTLTFLSLVILPPLVEETVFRGFVFTGIRNKLQPYWAAIVTSALFATAHLEFGSGQPLLWVAALDTFTLSLVLCYLRHKTDSLWPGILLHALKNGLAFVSLFIITTH